MERQLQQQRLCFPDLAVLEAENLILQRAARAYLSAFKRILDRVADVPPCPATKFSTKGKPRKQLDDGALPILLRREQAHGAFYGSRDETAMNAFMRSCMDERVIRIMLEK